MNSTSLWLGIDVFKATFDAAFPKGPGFAQTKLPRDRTGARKLLAWAREQTNGSSISCVMEATGGYSKQLACWMLQLQPDIHVAIAQPFQMSHFARALGQRNKTDALDAVMLARFGATFEPRAFHPMPLAYERLKELERECDGQGELPAPSLAICH
jgi:transposase